MLTPGEWDMISDTPATSVEDCAAQFLNDPPVPPNTNRCELSEFDPDTDDCILYLFSAKMENFVADSSSPYIVSDLGCFESC